ncbi:MAG: hypothetical protein ACRD0W_07815, partial [Acidimicrobiales bacterium]
MADDPAPRPARGNRRRTPRSGAADPRVGGRTEADGPLPRGPGSPPDRPGGQIEDVPGDQIEPKGEPSFDLSKWRPDVPMLLIPIRLETRYVSGDAHDELRIRILPDPVSVKGAASASAGELEEARDFWARYHAARGPDQRAATWRQYARRLGSTRAGYIARLTRPVAAADGGLTFPKATPETSSPALATLLPERWMATGWVGDTLAFRAFSKPVSGPLAVSPDPTVPANEIGGSGLRIDPATAWLFDYQQALDQGMAITVPLTGSAVSAGTGVSTLLVLGIDEAQRPSATLEDLQGLFEEHSRSTGLAFVPQGTPTNNTETVPSGYRREPTELADLEDRELGMYRPNDDDNAVVLARALGLPSSELFGRLAHGADRERAASRDMRVALFETVLGTYVRDLLATHDTDSDALTDQIDADVIAALRSWFVTWMTGGAPVPTIRVGDQPYGILPVMAREDASHSSETKQRIAAAVDVLIEEWRQALPVVPVLDHNATDAAGPAGELSNAEARDMVTAVLANNPHPRRIAVRAASDWSDQPQPVIFGATDRAAAMSSTFGQPVGNDQWTRPILMELTGGFRWEYHDALEELDTRYGTTLKPLYEAVRDEIVPPGGVLDDGVPTDPIGGVRRTQTREPAARTLEPGQLPSSEDDIRGIEQQIEIWVQTDSRIPTWGINLEWAKVDLAEVHEFAQRVIEQLERHELRQRPLRWLEVPGLDGVLGQADMQLLLTRFASVERLWRRATVQDDDPPAGITAATYLETLSQRALPGSSDGGPLDTDPRDPTDWVPGDGSLPGDRPDRLFPFDRLPPEF